LIHCQWGSERTGLVSAFATLLQPGATLADAQSQFSIRHLFVPVKDGKLMLAHLDQYAAWLQNHGWTHSPERFRTWTTEGFRPGSPGREDWAYDPYPLVVGTSPSGSEQKMAGTDADVNQK
jgi:hypothetical protein